MDKPTDSKPTPASELVRKASETLQTSSQTTIGEPVVDNVSPIDSQARRAVRRIFATLKTAYPAWYEKHFGDPRAETLAKRVWMTGVRVLSDEQVNRGLQRMVIDTDYPPTLHVFLSICRKVDGLPDPEDAWFDALKGSYSHEVVRVAAHLTGIYEIRRAQLGDKHLRATFQRNYAIVIRRLENGEPLDGHIAAGIGHDSQKSHAERAEEIAEQQLQERIQKQGIPASGKSARQMLLESMGIKRSTEPCHG